MSDRKIDAPVTTQPSWWARHRHFMFFMALAIATMQWALKQLTWLFGWMPEPRQGHLGQIFDAMVILAAGIFLMIHAIRHFRRDDAARQAARQSMLDGFHDRAVKAKQAKNLHA